VSVAGAGTFVAELVGDGELSNTVALNSTSFNAARMVGPAVAGIVIASIGTGWALPAQRRILSARSRARCWPQGAPSCGPSRCY
jgi:hypothetical protein